MRTYPVLSGCEAWSSPGNGPRGGVGIVVSHGFTGNPTSTRPLGAALAARGFAVDVVRLPGHGTHWRDMKHTRYRDWRGEVERAVERMAAQGKRTLLVGISMGGTITLDLACARPDVLVGACVINGAYLDRAGLVAKLAPILQYVLPVVPAKAAGLAANDIARGGDERAYPMVPTRAARSAMIELPRIRAAASGLRVPIVIAYSPQDHSVPAENSRTLLRMLAGKDATELVLPRSFHVATMDHDAELIVDAVTALADRVGAPR
jgi:carboxylesterase